MRQQIADLVVHDRKAGRKRQEETNFASLAKGTAKCSQFVMHNWFLAFREQEKKAVFSCKVFALSDSASLPKTHRGTDCRIVRKELL